MKCVVTNVETSQPSLISLFVTDFLLLLIMLAGLLRFRRGGTFRLGHLLWRQVRAAILAGCDVVSLLMHFTFEGSHLVLYCHRHRIPPSGMSS
jgi:hypothetical protein